MNSVESTKLSIHLLKNFLRYSNKCSNNVLRSDLSRSILVSDNNNNSQQYSNRNFFKSNKKLFQEKRDLYEVLGVSRSASKQDIKTAFYDLAKKYHPDANRDDPNASKKFAEISNAYDILYDENKRAMYDARGHQGATTENGYPGAGGPGGFHPNDINLEDLFGGINIEDLFGGGGGGRRGAQAGGVGEDIQVHVHLDFMEAIQGVDKDISFHGGSKCGTCDGSGAKPGTKPTNCKSCNGTGTQTKSNGFFQMQSTCRTCKGSGKVIKDHCQTCRGKGITEGMRTLSVKIPPGVNNGTNIKLTGQGEPAPGKSGRKGNLYISVTVSEHELFKRQGNDIHLDVPITLSQAILGATVSIPTLTGEVDLKVPAGTQPGERRVLKGKGVRSVNNIDYGNQYVHFIVSIPKSISSKQEKLIKEFEEEDKNNYGPIDSLSHPVLSFWNKSMKKWRDYLSKIK